MIILKDILNFSYHFLFCELVVNLPFLKLFSLVGEQFIFSEVVGILSFFFKFFQVRFYIFKAG